MKKFIFSLLILLGLALCWFLFIKKYDYRFHFEAKYGPGVVYNELEAIKDILIFKDASEIKNIRTEPYRILDQEIIFKNHSLDLHWELERKNDSLTDVYVHVGSQDKVKNRLAILNPFSNGKYIDSLSAIFIRFGQKLKAKQNTYRVTLQDSIVYSPTLNCICRSSKNIKVEDKAGQMVKEIIPLEDFMTDHDLKLNGYPFVKVTHWNRDENIIDFDFCFPVNLAQDIKPDLRVDFQELRSSTSLKAIYNGNYRSSDLAWYDLIDKAENEDYRTSGLPLEIFFNNPKNDVNPKNWKAEVYLPVFQNN